MVAAGSATYTFIKIDKWQSSHIMACIDRNYSDSLYGAHAHAFAAVAAVGVFNALVGQDTGFSYDCAVFLPGSKRRQRSCGTYLCACRAVVTALAQIEIENRMHDVA